MSTNSPTRGFTLIELLVVIAIIGLLSSVVLASLNTARAKARDAKRVSDLHQIVIALELQYDTAGLYPSITSTIVSTDLTSLAPTYISTLPTDPIYTGANGYRYATNSARTSYVVMATLEKNQNWCWTGPGADMYGWYGAYPHC